MTDADLIRNMAEKIATIKSAAADLRAMAGTSFPAVEKNADRILASVKMLELNISDGAGIK